MCFSHGQVNKQYNRGGKLFNKGSGKTCFHLAKKCKGPYIVGTRDTEELKTCNMRKLYWSVIRNFANGLKGIVGNGLGNEPAFTEELTPQVLPLSHENHSLYLSIHQTSHSSLQRSVCSSRSEGMEQQDFWNLPASRWDLSPRFRRKPALEEHVGSGGGGRLHLLLASVHIHPTSHTQIN